MNKHWQLRDEWYRIFHNWPSIIAFFILGGLLGWASGMIWPAYTRATREVYVALNPYRAYSDAQFLALAKPRYSNVDNYHYWQMNQLETVVYRSSLVRETLARLRQVDPYWDEIDAETLRNMLDTEWRTAGAWKLIAVHPEALRARQANDAWVEQVITSVPEAVAAARKTFVIEQQLSEANRILIDAQVRQQALAQANHELQAWRQNTTALPEDVPLPAEARWQVFSLTTAYAQENSSWDALLESQPKPDAPAAEYLAWTERVLSQFQTELDMLPTQIAQHETLAQSLQADYQTAADASLGLSPNLAIESIGTVEIEQVRPTTTLALVGAFLGMLIWLMIQLVRVNRLARSQPQMSASMRAEADEA